ncbi:MAG: cyclic nucleotide-binding domain-containing protein [Nitrospinaceae bacterium]|jgi:CRP-like cAMP-binding protein|nr:cyclic nucleotide-binding domain-containing protein [Nitrospinaceae bacterium]MBT3821288.1 cyclic nucleotide-binding domain-containing protein [Nitrospinaceae bacterium]MBT4092632.1 cyclic nucleotide-binding domain-containing protein [Nitrospinaceae bacterium]MBT4431066.1 cyclic nucleotide-binding domain-containing protein [Nitrospinaceae bacterium]MBT5367011.1 cyclic nucleotide-binding domain-containing protein [Nitrospinaceae bacterium]
MVSKIEYEGLDTFFVDAPYLSEKKLQIQDIRADRFIVEVDEIPEIGTVFNCSIEIKNKSFENCQSTVVSVNESLAVPTTWLVGLWFNIAEELKTEFDYIRFQLTREGKPSLQDLVGKLGENYGFFSQMSEKEIVWMLRLCGRRSFDIGQVIFQQGEMGNCFYLIVFGEVIIEKDGLELAKLGQGHCFGEMAVLENAPREAGATAGTDTLLFSIERDILVDAFPTLGFKVASNLAKELSEKLREMNQIVKNLTDDHKPETLKHNTVPHK